MASSIVHIATEEKFVRTALLQFSRAFPGRNTFYLISKKNNLIKNQSSLDDKIVLVEENEDALKSLAKSFSSNSVFIFHGFNYYSSLLALSLPPNAVIAWIVLGMEIYNNSELQGRQDNLLGPLTSSVFNSEPKSLIKNKASALLHNILVKVRRKKPTKGQLISKALKKATFCGILYREEFENMQRITKQNFKFFHFCFYPIELMLSDRNTRINGNNILIGNSASKTNNHLEAFQKLQSFRLSQQKIIVPLSYGDKQYAQEINRRGKENFGDDFDGILDFMPLKIYNSYVQSCGIVIMNHYRQQAVGNVLVMLWMGAKVFLDERNTLFHYLKRIGIKVFSAASDLSASNPECLENLPLVDQNNNRAILQTHIGEEVLISKLKAELVELMGLS